MNILFGSALAVWVVAQTASAQEARWVLDEFAVKKTLERATNTFANYSMYGDVNAFIGTTVEFRGSYRQKPVVIPEKRTYLQVAGRSAEGEYINLVAYLDSPLPTGRDYAAAAGSTPLIGPDRPYRFIGIIGKCRDFVDRTGHVLFLPTMELLLIYEADDNQFSQPLWVSKTLRRGQ